MQHLRSERGADELPVLVALADVVQVVGHRGTVLGVEVGVNLIEEVEGRGIALLDGEDEGQGTETWDCEQSDQYFGSFSCNHHRI